MHVSRALDADPSGCYRFTMTAKTSSVDAVEEAFLNAPIGEPLTEEESRLLAEARASRARGERTYSQDEVEAMIAEMRRAQEGG